MSNPLMAALHKQANFGPLWKQSATFPGRLATRSSWARNLAKGVRGVDSKVPDPHRVWMGSPAEVLGNIEAKAPELPAPAKIVDDRAASALLDVSGELSNREALLRNMTAQGNQHLLDVSGELSNQEALLRNLTSDTDALRQKLLERESTIKELIAGGVAKDNKAWAIEAEKAHLARQLQAAVEESASKYRGWVPLAAAGATGGLALPVGLVGGGLLGGGLGYAAR